MSHICKQNKQSKINHFERDVEKRVVEETVTKTFSIVQSNTIHIEVKKENNYMSTSDFDAITCTIFIPNNKNKTLKR